jgi:glycosyltransferase involved in cell wall biosynthesis
MSLTNQKQSFGGRIALWTPLPPTKSGIADYVAEMLPYLHEMFDVEIFVEDLEVVDLDLISRYSIHSYRTYKYRQAEAPFDVNIYQMGNNVYHLYIYEQALRVPGIVVLHDFSMASVLYHYYVGMQQDLDLFEQEFMYAEGNPALTEFQSYYNRGDNDSIIKFFSTHRMLRRLVENSQSFITHLPLTTQWLKEQYGAPNAIYSFLGSPDPYEMLGNPDRAALREKLGIAQETPVIGLFGHLQRTKQISVTLRAVSRMIKDYPTLKVLLVGQINPAAGYDEYLMGLIDELKIADNLELTGFVTKDQLLEYMIVTDVHVGLRYPSFGQMSATLSRGIAVGHPVIVTDLPEWQYLPEDFCWRVPPEDKAGHQLEKYLRKLINNPQLKQERGKNARAYYEQAATMKIAAENLAGEIINIIQDPEKYAVKGSDRPIPQAGSKMDQFQKDLAQYQRLSGMESKLGKRLLETPNIGIFLFGLYHVYRRIKFYRPLYHADIRMKKAIMGLIADMDTMQSEVVTPYELPPIRTMDNPILASWNKSLSQVDELSATLDVSDEDIQQHLPYIQFEHIFRGPSPVIAQRQKTIFSKLPIAENSKPIVDIGSGSGEFLGILKQNDVPSVGVETNGAQYKILQQMGYDVVLNDANTYLSSLDDGSIGGATAFHVVEHLDHSYLLDLLNLLHVKITAGGFVYLETPNPYNPDSLSTFYTDNTHVRPIQPFQLAYLLRTAGFDNLSIHFLQPKVARGSLSEESWLRQYRDFGIVAQKS